MCSTYNLILQEYITFVQKISISFTFICYTLGPQNQNVQPKHAVGALRCGLGETHVQSMCKYT